MFNKWSNNLPGVAINIFIPFYILILSNFLLLPPIISPWVLLWNVSNFVQTSYIYYASSLVGDIINTPVPLRYANFIF